MQAGYSGTPLLKKLGYRDGQRALLIGLPADLPELAGFPGFAARTDLPDPAALDHAPKAAGLDLVHLFVREHALLAAHLPGLARRLAPAGMLWVSWPKQASRQPTDITEDRIRALALAAGLVDVKVCAVDAVWSGLKLVIPRALRPRTGGRAI